MRFLADKGWIGMKKIGLLAVLIGALLLGISSVYAGARNLELIPGCTGYGVNSGTLIGERNNTGRGVESFVVRVRDGRGALVYDLVVDVPIGGRYSFPVGALLRYPLPVRANPITLTVTSIAGNGQDAVTLYTNAADCGAIGGEATLAVAGDPNRLPRLTNPAGLAESDAAYGIVDTDNLNLRTGDSVRYARIAILDGGTTLILLGNNGARTADALWWYVEVGGVRGWVKNEFIVIRGNTAALPVIETRGALAIPYFILGAPNLLRTVPAPGATVLCSLPANINFPVLQKDAAQASWFQIEAVCGGATVLGWVQADAGFIRNESGVAIPTP
jgi:hypothetical protein